MIQVRHVFRALATISGIALLSAPLAAQEQYVGCVNGQLASLGYQVPQGGSKKVPQATVAAAEALRAQYAGRREIALLPRITDRSAVSWCREIGALNTSLRRFMPSARPPLVLSKAGSGSAETAMLAQAFAEAEQFFRTTWGIYLASRVDIAGASNGRDLASLAVDLQRQNGPSQGRMDSRVGRVCGNPARYYGGQAHRDQLLICWPASESSAADLRGKTRSRVASIMIHEYTHHIQVELANDKVAGGSPYARSRIGPAWMVEGMAEYAELRWAAGRRIGPRLGLNELQKEARELQKPLRAMHENQSVKGREQYYIARFAVYLLATRYGDRALVDYFRHIGQGKTWEQAFEAAFGMKMGAYQSAFETYRVDGVKAAAFAARK